MILEVLLAEVRTFEVSEQQATDIESPGGANALLLPKSETPDKAARCFNYEKIDHTMPKLDVLLGICKKYGHYAQHCRSLVGEAEHIEKETGSKDVEIPFLCIYVPYIFMYAPFTAAHGFLSSVYF